MDVWAYQERYNQEDISNKVGVASMVDKIREGKLRWFGYSGLDERQRQAEEILGEGDQAEHDAYLAYQGHDLR